LVPLKMAGDICTRIEEFSPVELNWPSVRWYKPHQLYLKSLFSLLHALVLYQISLLDQFYKFASFYLLYKSTSHHS
jgi:hypothetical protein